ncbi:MAG: helix-turn-helix domain-containing protein [Coriobacteriia bacterium]|nr:helix-turn-helix domain-containing protein [Coriobacteriia bacterium]
MEQKNSNASRLVTVEELSAFLQVPTSWVYARTAANSIPHVRVGRYVRFRLGEVMKWLADGGE